MTAMESNIKKGYEVKTNSDGSVCICFAVPAISGASSAAGCGSLLFVIVGAFSGLFSAAVTNSQVVGWIVGIGVTVGIFKLGNKLFKEKKQDITVFPKNGIKHGDTQLALSDIQSIGFSTLSNKNGSAAYVYANALGQEVRLSGDINPTLAAGIAREVRNATATSWD